MGTLSLGFDVRMRAADYAQKIWTPEHRASYLLRRDVEWPLSIDRSVWPSFLQNYYFDATGNRIANPRFAGQSIASLENEFGLLPNLNLVRQAADIHHGVGLGVEVIYRESKEINLFNGVEASAIPSSAEVLGFDVATPAPISGLCNCGYDPSEIQQLRDEWENKLNEYGLLGSVEHARHFKEMTNKRVPEHAPFYLYKLFRLKLSIDS